MSLGKHAEADILKAVEKAGSHGLRKAAELLEVKPADLAHWLGKRSVALREHVHYAFDERTKQAMTCPHCACVGPVVDLDDPRDYLLGAYGGEVDSYALAGLQLTGRCGACNKKIRLAYGLVAMDKGQDEKLLKQLKRLRKS